MSAPTLVHPARAALAACEDPAQIAAVRRWLACQLRSEPAELDDLVQMTFLEAWRSAHRFSGESAVRSWLFGIAANLVRHHVRGARRRRDAYARVPAPSATAAGPADAAIHAQELAQVARALAALPHELRRAYVMCELEDLPGPEAARRLAVAPGTLWRRLHEARRALRAAAVTVASPKRVTLRRCVR